MFSSLFSIGIIFMILIFSPKSFFKHNLKFGHSFRRAASPVGIVMVIYFVFVVVHGVRLCCISSNGIGARFGVQRKCDIDAYIYKVWLVHIVIACSISSYRS